ncbi:MAG: lysophospholipid acyltransferase family protein [Planctomycetia bacterium]|nr:lysophospholipid acyltransferase family protein [Planctomycetia bacterium]
MENTFFKRCYYSSWCALIWLFGKIWLRVKYVNWRSVPRTGSLILIANHQSFLDPPLLGVGLKRYSWYMARKTLFRGLFGWHLRQLNAYPVSQEGNAVAGIKTTFKLLKNDQCVLIFPEGSRSLDGTLQPFQGGILMIAKRAKVPIIPCSIWGAHQAMPRGSSLIWPCKVTVRYGEVIPPEAIEGMTEQELMELLYQKIAALLPPEALPKTVE